MPRSRQWPGDGLDAPRRSRSNRTTESFGRSLKGASSHPVNRAAGLAGDANRATQCRQHVEVRLDRRLLFLHRSFEQLQRVPPGHVGQAVALERLLQGRGIGRKLVALLDPLEADAASVAQALFQRDVAPQAVVVVVGPRDGVGAVTDHPILLNGCLAGWQVAGRGRIKGVSSAPRRRTRAPPPPRPGPTPRVPPRPTSGPLPGCQARGRCR